ncbi:hypothetical protein JKL49_08475 [Phenylobacterium sp. 20VBR1]|uniref:Glycerophosphoryl diester phosphodiesterase membrane domain-containing protein n=1 Tax=Phenylobacterium glaciei TaxID=2803784 RepID=A0A941D121_9CAUL|nr:hypothetical protein [Phenylobacterium glaciei]MBR7619419.1 hypothetical protein [Phenylobacterium glaciei]
MTKFSPSDSALEGFRITRERPGTILAWSLVYFLGIMVIAMIMVTALGPDFIKFVQKGGLESGDAGAYGAVLRQHQVAFLAIIVISIFLLSVLMGGIYRLALRPSEKGIAHLRLGADELRLTVVNLALFSVGVLFLVLTFGAAKLGGPFGVLVSLALAVAMIWAGVRLLLATPMTFAEHRIAILDSWRLTKGHFWSLFGMTILAIIFYIMVWLLFSIISYATVAIAGGNEAISNPANLAPLAIVAFIATLMVQLLLPILQVVMIYSPLAEAYRELTGAPRG